MAFLGNLGYRSLFFLTLNIFYYPLLCAKFLLRNQLTAIWLLLVDNLLLGRFSLCLKLWHFNWDVSWCGPLSVLHKVRKAFQHYFSNRFSVPCLLFSFQQPHETSVVILLLAEAPYTVLIFLGSSCFLLFWLDIFCFLNFQLANLILCIISFSIDSF